MRAWSIFILHVLSLLFLLKLAPCDFTYLYNILCVWHVFICVVCLFVCFFFYVAGFFLFFIFVALVYVNDTILDMRINQPK